MPTSDFTADTIHALMERHSNHLPIDFAGMDSFQLDGLANAGIWRWKAGSPDEKKARSWNFIVRSADGERHRRAWGWTTEVRW